ncbi:hypothetical protein FACS1894162_7360 [Bacteroidia bacterium]|nr:hypothetical protein FACS1894162_7360 [Bacteroidia bacterium]
MRKIGIADPQNLICELGRGSGKTTHIMGPRLDRVLNSMPGATIALGATAYRDIFSNILPELMDYFGENYERGMYYEIGKEPPKHFKKPNTPVFDCKHTISHVNGAVVQFVSADRPESVIGANYVHGFFDELLKINKSFMLERFIDRWSERLALLRKGQTFYARASSFSNLKILGIDYIENQINTSGIVRLLPGMMPVRFKVLFSLKISRISANCEF